MSKSGDNTQPAPRKRGDGSLTRYAFTLAITTAIALAIIAFMYLLEQRTGEAATRLDIPQRTASQVYADAEQLEAPALRQRALRNFVKAYPDAPESQRAKIEIEELEFIESQDFAALTETFYDIRASREDKVLALDTFTALWGKTRFETEITSMELKLGEESVDLDRRMDESLGANPALAGQQKRQAVIDNIQNETIARESDMLAGGIVLEPVVIAPVMPAPPARVLPKIIEATVKKDATPRYPRRAQSRGVEAVVVVAMDIDAQGKVQDARVIKPPTGRYVRDFNRAAIAAAKRTTFNPKMVDGKASPTNGHVRNYKFELED